MAKSIYEVLDSMVTETSVPAKGKMVEHTIPRDLLPTSEEFENEEKLLEWAQANNVLHACMQSGVQKRLIDLRAKFKAVKKDEEWTPEMGQKAVDESTWDIVKRPKVAKSDADIATEYLASLSEKDREKFIASMPAK
jgi:hypothetical protein